MFERVARRVSQGVDEARGRGRRDVSSYRVFDLRGALEQQAISLMNLNERIDNGVDWRLRQRQRASEGTHGILVADTSQRFGDDARQHGVAQQQREPWGDERIADAHQRFDGGKGEKEVPRDGNLGEAVDGLGMCLLADGFDRMKTHVDVGVVERGNQRLDGFGPALGAERERRLDAEVGIVVAHQRHQRFGNVDPGEGEELQRAAQQAEIAMPVSERRNDGVDERRVASAGERAHRRPPDLPVVVGERRADRSQAVGGLELGQAPDRDDPIRRRAVAELTGDAPLVLEPRGHIFDRDHQADRSVVVAQCADHDALLHIVEFSGRFGRWAGDQVLVQRRRQDLARIPRPEARGGVPERSARPDRGRWHPAAGRRPLLRRFQSSARAPDPSS